MLRFLAIGLVLYLGASWLSTRTPGASAPARPAEMSAARETSLDIEVDRENLLAFVQRRTQQPDARTTQATFDALSAAARKDWVDRYVREEALVREARRLGLDRDDELIRRRLVQKIEFLTLGVAESEIEPDAHTLSAYYREHAEAYRVPGSLSFAHVFVRPGEAAQRPESRARAADLLAQLNRESVTAREALELGDRFLYNRHYVERTLDEVRSHFGDAMAEILAAASPDPSLWQGPIESIHGWHLVLLRAHEPGRLPPLDEIAVRIREDVMRERSEAALEAGLRSAIGRYRVELDPALAEGGTAAKPAD